MQSTVIKTERTHGKAENADGGAVLTYIIDTPSVAGDDGFNEFYLRVRDNLVEFCRQRLILKCGSGGQYSYKHTCKAHMENGILTLTLKTVFADKVTHRVLSSHIEKHKWKLDGKKSRLIK